MARKQGIQWLPKQEAHDFAVSQSYLSLVFKETIAKRLVARLKKTRRVQFKAKDIFRASGLVLLPASNSHVKKGREKIESGKKLSPLLLVRDSQNGKVIIADGDHR